MGDKDGPHRSFASIDWDWAICSDGILKKLQEACPVRDFRSGALSLKSVEIFWF
jgi:hypothetical protein